MIPRPGEVRMCKARGVETHVWVLAQALVSSRLWHDAGLERYTFLIDKIVIQIRPTSKGS